GEGDRADQSPRAHRRDRDDRVVVDEGGCARRRPPPSARANVLDDLRPDGFSPRRRAPHVRAGRPRGRSGRRRARGVVRRRHRGDRRLFASARGLLPRCRSARVHAQRIGRRPLTALFPVTILGSLSDAVGKGESRLLSCPVSLERSVPTREVKMKRSAVPFAVAHVLVATLLLAFSQLPPAVMNMYPFSQVPLPPAKIALHSGAPSTQVQSRIGSFLPV